VLKVIEDSVKEEAGAVHPEGAKTAREIGAQPDATREDISHVRRKVDEAASDVKEIKEKFTQPQESCAKHSQNARAGEMMERSQLSPAPPLTAATTLSLKAVPTIFPSL
jgi:ATPase subunit of ABC transporter with duplicated ATPase domains